MILEGSVGKILFQAGDYNVFEFLSVADTDPFKRMQSRVVGGSLFGLSLMPGVHVRLVGQMVQHPKYGPQFSPHTWEPWAPGIVQARDFLVTCLGLDRSIARVLTDAFKAETLSVLGAIKVTPQDLVALGTTDTERDALGKFHLTWDSLLDRRDFARILSVGGFTSWEVDSAFQFFGSDAISLIRDNPYILAIVTGVSFSKIDLLADRLGIDDHILKRAQGGILWALKMSLKDGHLYLDRAGLAEQLGKLKGVPPINYMTLAGGLAGAYAGLVSRGFVVLDRGGIYLKDSFLYENVCARKLAERSAKQSTGVANLENFISGYETSNQIQLSPEQRSAVESMLAHRVLVVTGLPGTGKSSSVRAMVGLLQESRISFHLMAPTGIAAKRLSAVTGQAAGTIHRTLKYNGNAWGHNRDNKFVVDVVIVDEMSMVDQELLYRLLDALPDTTRVILVGDDAQLPSVGAGNVLRELAGCSEIPKVRLTQIFRQASQSAIVRSSHAIHNGDMPELAAYDSDSDFKFIPLSDESKILDLVVSMAAKLKARDANFQVLSPMYGGTVGVDALNLSIRDAVNPAGPGVAVWSGKRDLNYRVGDRVMVISNDYQKGVFNGDVGKVSQVVRSTSKTKADGGLLVKVFGAGIDGTDLEVLFSDSEVSTRLKLAFAVTVHKCQGQEFDTIILPVARSQGLMLQRNLLYTAVTRARSQVWLVGDISSLDRAVRNNQVILRRTNLGSRIDAYMPPDLDTI